MAAEKIGVVGAGLMGAEIALVFALAGHDVVLSDRTDEQLAAAKNRLATTLDRGIPRGFFKAEDREPALARICTTTALADFAECDFVTEAVFEDEAVKAEIYRDARPSVRSRLLSSPATPRRSRSRPWPPMSARRAGRVFSARIISRRPRA